MDSPQGDAHRIEVAEERVAQCMRRLVKVALALDRVRSWNAETTKGDAGWSRER
jgi:hypothetical protein